jgi:hypothetical protein
LDVTCLIRRICYVRFHVNHDAANRQEDGALAFRHLNISRAPKDSFQSKHRCSSNNRARPSLIAYTCYILLQLWHSSSGGGMAGWPHGEAEPQVLGLFVFVVDRRASFGSCGGENPDFCCVL